MAAIILNGEDHSIANLPTVILEKIFNNLRGRTLIKITAVCKSFNEAVGSSPQLMNKIRLRIPSRVKDDTFELFAYDLNASRRVYRHLALHKIEFVPRDLTETDGNSFRQFLHKREGWKSLQIASARFWCAKSRTTFLSLFAPHLEELDLGHSYTELDSPSPLSIVSFPKLRALTTKQKIVDIQCSTLTSLDIAVSGDNPFDLFLTNNVRTLTVLKTTYDVICQIDARTVTNLRLKVLHVRGRRIGNHSNTQFLDFLKSQSECLEEFMIEWCSICQFSVDALRLVLSEFKNIRKLILKDNQSSLSPNKFVSNAIRNLTFEPNQNIIELRFRSEISLMSNYVFESLVTACPNVKSLFVHSIDQNWLKICASELRELESLTVVSFQADELPSENIKFSKLKQTKFWACQVTNQQTLLNQLSTAESKSKVLEFLVN